EDTSLPAVRRTRRSDPAGGDLGDDGARGRLLTGCEAGGEGSGGQDPVLEGTGRARRQVRRPRLSLQGPGGVERPLTGGALLRPGLVLPRATPGPTFSPRSPWVWSFACSTTSRSAPQIALRRSASTR